MSQYLQQNDEIKLSILINQIGKKFLSSMPTAQQIAHAASNTNEHIQDQSSTSMAAGHIELSDEIGEQIMPKFHTSTVHNEELKALERFVARERTPHTILTGNEDAAVVYTFINATAAKQSYKEGKRKRFNKNTIPKYLYSYLRLDNLFIINERLSLYLFFLVQKFRKRPAYIEYLTQVLIKSLLDSSNDDILNWYDDNQSFLSKRNELILGPWHMVISKGDGIIAITGSNENKYGMKDLDIKHLLMLFSFL